MDLTKLTVPQRVSIGAMAVVVIGAFLPWVSLFGFSVRGTDGDGVITLLVALVGVVVLLVTSGVVGASAKQPGRVSQIALIVLAAVVSLIGVIDMNGAAAIGLYLTLLAGLTWLAAAIWQMATSNQTASPTA